MTNSLAFHLNLTPPFYDAVVLDLKPDVLHAHFGYDGYKLLGISGRRRIPLVTSFYGSDVSRLPGELGWKKRYKKLAARGSHFIAASDFMKSQMTELDFPENKISVIRFGLDAESYPFSGKEDVSRRKILMVGRLVEKKGFEYAIRAIAKSRKNGTDWTATIYGDGPLRKSLEQLTRELHLENVIRFSGFQPVDVILQAHRSHSLLMAPSVTASDGDMEGLPNTILEAMALGTPVIATRHAAIPEAVTHGHSGFLAEERDVNGLSAILDEIADHRFDLESVARKAREVIEQNHTIEKMVDDVERVYDKLVHTMGPQSYQ